MSAPALDRRSDYVSAVAVELQDLGGAEREELIEELDDHIAALLVDRPDADLVTELGSPHDYALELRAAAGLDAEVRATPPLALGAQLKALAERTIDLGRALTPKWLDRLTPDLGPAWWVLRAYLVVIVIVQALRSGHVDMSNFLWPTYATHRWPAAIIVAALALLSVRLGRRRPGDAWIRLVVAVVDVVIVVAAALLYRSQLQYDDYGSDNFGAGPTCNITNLYPRDSNGAALTGVTLYDQNGNLVNLSDLGCPVEGNTGSYAFVSVAPTGSANTFPLPQQTLTTPAASSGSTGAVPTAQDTSQGVPTK